VSEAEAMVYGGVPDVLVTNEIVGRAKLARLLALAKQARVAVCADDARHVEDLEEAAAFFGVPLPVLVEVNVGSNRCGAEPGEPAAALAERIAGSRALRFAGLQAYYGSAQHIRAYRERESAIDRAAEAVRATLDALGRKDIPCETITGAGTGTYGFEIASRLFTEIQPGSYVFMDADYARNLAADGAPARTFAHALFVYTTVMSRPAADRAVVDAGLKAVSVDSGMPAMADAPGIEYVGAADEHGRLRLREPGRAPAIGDKLRLIPGHCDPTVNLYDWYVGVRGPRVEAVWPVAARGAVA
jgi:D-serine deaminase-like pyridoxal phosphate-dependent protein